MVIVFTNGARSLGQGLSNTIQVLPHLYRALITQLLSKRSTSAATSEYCVHKVLTIIFFSVIYEDEALSS